MDLNTRSSVNFKRALAGFRSMELIAGEAAIDITAPQAAPVTIFASGGRIEALDAAFTLRNDDRAARLACLRGSVDLDYDGERRTVSRGMLA
jgi:ferric-dicitrate binding protein FerR (iron transport regulator)